MFEGSVGLEHEDHPPRIPVTDRDVFQRTYEAVPASGSAPERANLLRRETHNGNSSGLMTSRPVRRSSLEEDTWELLAQPSIEEQDHVIPVPMRGRGPSPFQLCARSPSRPRNAPEGACSTRACSMSPTRLTYSCPSSEWTGHNSEYEQRSSCPCGRCDNRNQNNNAMLVTLMQLDVCGKVNYL